MGGYNGGMTLKLSRCVRIMYLHMCAKFQVSMVNSCRENPDWGGFRFSKVRFSFKFSSKFRRVKFLFLNQHVPNRLSLLSDDWRQHQDCRKFLDQLVEKIHKTVYSLSSSSQGLYSFCPELLFERDDFIVFDLFAKLVTGLAR